MKLGIAALALALIAPGTAALAANDSIQSRSDINVRAVNVERHGSLTTIRQADGSYTATIDVADLDARTPAGWKAMTRRVALGTAVLCDLAHDEPRVAGYHNAGQRACWKETRSQASMQMDNARQAALKGERVLVLGLDTRSRAR